MRNYHREHHMTPPEDLEAWADKELSQLTEHIKEVELDLDAHRLELELAQEMVLVAEEPESNRNPLLVAWCGRTERWGNSPWKAASQVKDSLQWIGWDTEKLTDLKRRQRLVWDALQKVTGP